MEKKLTKELLELLSSDEPREFRKALTKVILEWAEAEMLPLDKADIIHKFFLLIEFFDKVEEIQEKGK